jgi:hypothetical protein
VQVAQWLAAESVDVIELSGGTYEQPRLVDLQGIEEVAEQSVKPSTRAREAYFIDFAQAMQKHVSIPLMVTGGLRKRAAMEQAIETGGAELVGIGRPMCVDADAPRQLLQGEEELNRYEQDLSLLPGFASCLNRLQLVRTISGFSKMYWFYAQLYALAETGKPKPGLSVFEASLQVMQRERVLLRRMSRRPGQE